jgi:hypothetical protein
MRDETDCPCEIHEISVNGRLCYCSGKEKGSLAREDSSVVSEEIEKDAIKGYLIYAYDCSTYAAILRAKTSVYKHGYQQNCTLKGNNAMYIYLNPKHKPPEGCRV